MGHIIRVAPQPQDRQPRPMPNIDYITAKGFKSIASTEKLELGALNVLIGPNGSGKSNFLGLFSLLKAIRDGGLQAYVAREAGAEKVLHFGSRETPQLEIEVSFGSGDVQYRIALLPNQSDELVPGIQSVLSERSPLDNGEAYTVSSVGKTAWGESLLSDDIPSTKHTERVNRVRDLLAGFRVYHFHDTSFHSPMKKTGNIHDNRYLRPDGGNLAPFLYLLREMHEDSYRLIEQTVQKVVPFFIEFMLAPRPENPDTIRLEWKHVGTDDYFDAGSLSDGTLRFMALATLFLQPVEYRPSVILVDEPELGMHPSAIALLASLMQYASVDTQVVVATHSSLLVDYFEPEDVLVADRVGGGTQFTRHESSKLAPWLEDYSLGQLWEKNELGGHPKPEYER